MLEVGEIIKIKGLRNKRMVGEVCQVGIDEGGYNMTIRGVYRPSPKSRLKNKTKFSKHKMRIV